MTKAWFGIAWRVRPLIATRWFGVSAKRSCKRRRIDRRRVRRVMIPKPGGVHIITFEACSGFTRVTACWIAQPPKATFVTRLRPVQVARQLPGPTDNFLGGSFLHW
jgi:hypothetical protein